MEKFKERSNKNNKNRYENAGNNYMKTGWEEKAELERIPVFKCKE